MGTSLGISGWNRKANAEAGTSAPPAELILGYTTPLSVRPGATVEVRARGTAERYRAALVRLSSAGPGPRAEYELLEDLGPKRLAPQDRMIRNAGSSIVVGPSSAFSALSSFTVSVWIFPTLLTPAAQTLFGTTTGDGRAGWSTLLDEERGIGLRLAAPEEPIELWSGIPVAPLTWTHVTVGVDVPRSRVQVIQTRSAETPQTFESAVSIGTHQGADTLSIAAPNDRDRPILPDGNGCFNGKLSDPTVYGGVFELGRAGELCNGVVDDPEAPVVCHLDLAEAIDSTELRDRSPHGHRVVVLNQPTAGVTGPRWRGRTTSFIQARDQYSAIHFHDDDLEDADWEVAFDSPLPSDLPTGVYAARLATSDCEDLVPFYVTAPGTATADALLLLPTLTYLAYANEHEILSNPPSYTAFTRRDSEDAELGWRDWLVVEEGLLSLYDVHRDGSSVCFASTKRPLLNVRPDYVWPLLEGPHGLAMDLRLIAWLDREGFGHDLITDHDLHEFGSEALEPYRVVITGAHPEYWTGEMLDSLRAYLDGGGRLLYLGGNGLHGVTGIDTERPHIAEVRRPLFGSRPSSSAPGELWLTTTKEEGGIWRARGRSSHAYTGVGTTAMGAGAGRPYQRTSASHDPAYSWIFEGIEGDLIGATGGILGGAAAYEFDRADRDLGTPGYAEVLASATGFRELYFPMLEDFVGSCPEVADPGSPLVRADMVIMVRANGGGAFSVGSAAWCGSLGDPSVATVTANVLRRFVATALGDDPLQRDRNSQ